MREMKDSGIAWIGEIPADWETPKMKYIAENITDFTASGSFADLAENVKYLDYEDYAMLVRTVDLSAKRKIQHIYVNRHAYDYLKNSNLHGGELILPNIGSVGMIYKYVPLYKKSTLAPNSIMIRSQNNNYLYYLFLNSAGEEALKRLSSATTQAKFNKTQLRNLKVILPNLEEQQKIADFLDAKCGEIDGILGDIEAQVETLEAYKRSVITEAVTKGLHPDAEMKDSGVAWIGEIPADWKVIRGKYILRYLQKSVKKNDGVITCFRDGEVTLRSNRREDGFTIAQKEIGYQGVDVGDLVVHGMDGFAGSIGISDSRGKASPVLNVLDTVQNKRYIMYYLRSMAYSDVFLALATGIRVRSCDLRWNKLSELLYPVPPIDEQGIIVNFVDDVISKVDALIAGKKEQAETLRAYKKSLIFEYVTGKKEVPAV